MKCKANEVKVGFLIAVLVTGLSCSKPTSNDPKAIENSHQQVDLPNASPSANELRPNEIILDTIVCNLDDDLPLEKIIVTEGYYELENYKFEILDDAGADLGTLYSQFRSPWLDSLENGLNACKILWTSNYLNGSDMGGIACYGYQVLDHQLHPIISIPGSYYGTYSIPNEKPFRWGNILLLGIQYRCPKSILVDVTIDLHEAASWELMDSVSQTRYEKRHRLEYVWLPEQHKYLAHSPHGKRTTYDISTVYEMTYYLEAEFGLEW